MIGGFSESDFSGLADEIHLFHSLRDGKEEQIGRLKGKCLEFLAKISHQIKQLESKPSGPVQHTVVSDGDPSLDPHHRACVRWVNSFISPPSAPLQSLADMGMYPLALVELAQAFGCTERFNKKPKMRIQKIENNAKVLNFLRSNGVKVMIDAADICDGNVKLIQGLIWTWMLKFQCPSDGSVKIELMLWLKDLLPQHNINSFCQGWNSGLIMFDLVCAVDPHRKHNVFDFSLYKYLREQTKKSIFTLLLCFKRNNMRMPADIWRMLIRNMLASDTELLQLSFTIAKEDMGIPALLDVQCMGVEQCVVMYLVAVKNFQEKSKVSVQLEKLRNMKSKVEEWNEHLKD